MDCLVQPPNSFWTGVVPHGLPSYHQRSYFQNFYFPRKRGFNSSYYSAPSLFFPHDDDVDYPTDIKGEPVSSATSSSAAGMLPSTTMPYHCMADESEEIKMCVVCGERASGFYFGALVCLPCKSFYIRCTKEGEPAFTCQCSGHCDIVKQGRIRCQYCRYQRCLLAGMCRKETTSSSTQSQYDPSIGYVSVLTKPVGQEIVIPRRGTSRTDDLPLDLSLTSGRNSNHQNVQEPEGVKPGKKDISLKENKSSKVLPGRTTSGTYIEQEQEGACRKRQHSPGLDDKTHSKMVCTGQKANVEKKTEHFFNTNNCQGHGTKERYMQPEEIHHPSEHNWPMQTVKDSLLHGQNSHSLFHGQNSHSLFHGQNSHSLFHGQNSHSLFHGQNSRSLFHGQNSRSLFHGQNSHHLPRITECQAQMQYCETVSESQPDPVTTNENHATEQAVYGMFMIPLQQATSVPETLGPSAGATYFPQREAVLIDPYPEATHFVMPERLGSTRSVSNYAQHPNTSLHAQGYHSNAPTTGQNSHDQIPTGDSAATTPQSYDRNIPLVVSMLFETSTVDADNGIAAGSHESYDHNHPFLFGMSKSGEGESDRSPGVPQTSGLPATDRSPGVSNRSGLPATVEELTDANGILLDDKTSNRRSQESHSQDIRK